MIAFRIHHNDVPLCVAGASDLVVLNAIVNAIGKLGPDTADRHPGKDTEPDLFLSVGGLTSRTHNPDEHLRWLEHTPLAIGDRITITLINSDEPDGPVSSRAADARESGKEKQGVNA